MNPYNNCTGSSTNSHFNAFQQQHRVHGSNIPGRINSTDGRRGKRARRGNRSRTDTDVADLVDAARSEYQNRLFDNAVTNPGFWATVFTTLRDNTEITEEIRRDLEQQELLATPAYGTNTNRNEAERESRGDTTGTDRQQTVSGEDTSGVGTDNFTAGPDSGVSGRGFGPTRSEELPVLYDVMSEGFVDNETNRTAGGVKRLDLLMDELDIETLWSARDVTIPLGALTRIMLRLFAGPYATEEERVIVRMLNLGLERAYKSLGFEEYTNLGDRRFTQEPFLVTYRRRSRVLRDFAAFRYMLEVTENMGRIGRKHKTDLVLLYSALTTPEVRLHRKMNTADRENVFAFRDVITGFSINTPPVMAKPMSIEMHLDSVFGNVSTNTRLLERSLVAALNNRHKKIAGLNSAREVESLLGNAILLDLSNDGAVNTSSPQTLLPYRLDQSEHTVLSHMLETSLVVSMMAEEFRVFVAGAPPSRCGAEAAGDSRNGGSRTSSQSKTTRQPRQQQILRRPVFFTFKPVTQATVHKQ